MDLPMLLAGTVCGERGDRIAFAWNGGEHFRPISASAPAYIISVIVIEVNVSGRGTELRDDRQSLAVTIPLSAGVIAIEPIEPPDDASTCRSTAARDASIVMGVGLMVVDIDVPAGMPELEVDIGAGMGVGGNVKARERLIPAGTCERLTGEPNENGQVDSPRSRLSAMLGQERSRAPGDWGRGEGWRGSSRSSACHLPSTSRVDCR